MQAILDSNRLLTIANTTLDTGKSYQQDFQGYQIFEKNTLLFVWHKKEVKLMELKHIGATMGVFYLAQRPPFHKINLVSAFVHLAGEHFGGFDEETGERYYFFPYFSPQRVEAVNAVFAQLGVDLQLVVTAKGVIAPRKTLLDLPADGSIEQLLSHFFGLTLLYGKFETKNGQLNSSKIQIPLLNAYAGLQEVFQKQVARLQEYGFFLQTSLNTQQGKTTLQITSNDWELLQMFAEWYSPIEKFSQITKKEQTAQAKAQLLAFLAAEQIENATEITALIESGTLKVLVK